MREKDRIGYSGSGFAQRQSAEACACAKSTGGEEAAAPQRHTCEKPAEGSADLFPLVIDTAKLRGNILFLLTFVFVILLLNFLFRL